MKIVLSRKGFDSAAGKAPSPIVNGRPVSMPIPATRSSATTYADIGLGDLVERITTGRMGRMHLCHPDPMFVGEECIFGQVDAAQSHLSNQGVGVGDLFLFFGLFADEATGERHHRFFGYLRVQERHLVSDISDDMRLELEQLKHPHVLGMKAPNNTIYRGEGRTALKAHPGLRLTQTGGPLSRWIVPTWMRERGLTYHSKPTRWIGESSLDSVARGQEFVCDVGDDPVAIAWAEHIVGMVRS